MHYETLLYSGIYSSYSKRNKHQPTASAFLQYIDAVGLSWDVDTMPVKQKHDHHGRRILRILNCREGNGKPPRLINSKTCQDGTTCQKPAA